MTDMCSFPEIPADTVSKGTSKKSITDNHACSIKQVFECNWKKKKEGKCFVDITVGLTIRKEFSVRSPVKIAYM